MSTTSRAHIRLDVDALPDAVATAVPVAKIVLSDGPDAAHVRAALDSSVAAWLRTQRMQPLAYRLNTSCVLELLYALDWQCSLTVPGTPDGGQW